MGAVLLATPVAAATNLDFETGDTSGWVSGGSMITGATGGYGSFAPFTGLFLGFAEGDMQDVYSTLSQTFALGAGDRLDGYFGFRANDVYEDSGNIFNDDGYLAINGVNLLSFDVLAVGDFGNSGWVPFTFTAPGAGNYTLEIGAANRGDSGFASGVVIDAVSLTVAPIPEPQSWALLVVGFGLAGSALRRQRAAAGVAG
jgi:hypothetical protein